MLRTAILLCTAWLLLASSAVAQGGDGGVVVLNFSGPRGAEARDAVEASLESAGVEVLDVTKVEQAVERLGADLQSATGRQEIAESQGIRAFVAGRVEPAGKRRFRVRMGVFSGSDGSMVGTAAIGMRRQGLTKKLAGSAAAKLRAGLGKARKPAGSASSGSAQGGYEFGLDEVEPESPPPSVSSREEEDRAEREESRRELATRRDDEDEVDTGIDDEEAEDDEVVEDDDDGPRPSRSPLVLGGGISFLSRSLAFKDKVGSLSDHKIQANPALVIQGRFYPVGLVQDDWLAHLGLEFKYGFLLFASSRKGDEEFDTTAHDLLVGLHGRLPIGDHDLGVGLGYGSQSMAFEPGSDGSSAGVPEYGYRFVRFAADARFVFGDLALEPRFALLMPLGFGEVERNEWFPHMSGTGLDTGLTARWAIGEHVELLGGVSYRQWGLTFNPEEDDLRVSEYGGAAGGATDRYWSIDIGAAYRF